MLRLPRVLLALIPALALVSTANALPPGYTLRMEHGNLNFTVGLRFSPDHRLFTITKGGRVMVYNNPSDPVAKLWASFPVDSAYERGLLGIDFHPQYPDSPYVYFYYTNASPLQNRVVRMYDLGDHGYGPWILTQLPGSSTYHHGGRVQFGPDGLLYVTYGDQLDASAAPDPSSVRGKLLRLTPMGKPAPGNPWANEALLRGVRNVFGVCFDRVTQIGYFTENGPSCDDHIQHMVLGADYGWSNTSVCGSLPSGAMPPMLTYSQTIAPTGCIVYRSPLDPSLDGNLLFGSYNDGTIRRAYFNPSDRTQISSVEPFLTLPSDAILDITQDSEGMLWLCTPGYIYRILPPQAVTGVGAGVTEARLALAPNPFRTALSVTPGAGAGFDRIEIADVAGRTIRTWRGPFTGTVTWDGTDRRGLAMPPGVYLVRAIGERGTRTERVIHLAR